MRWINVFYSAVGSPALLGAVMGDIGVEQKWALLGHTWAEDELIIGLSGLDNLASAVGDAIEREVFLERLVGDLTFVGGSQPSGEELVGIIRTGFIVQGTDGEGVVLEISLITANGQGNDLEGSWLDLKQFGLRSLIDNQGQLREFEAVKTIHYDVRVNRRIGPQDMLVMNVAWMTNQSTPVDNPTTVMLYHGHLRALVRD